jgi:hypothetical protein
VQLLVLARDDSAPSRDALGWRRNAFDSLVTVFLPRVTLFDAHVTVLPTDVTIFGADVTLFDVPRDGFGNP